MKDLVFKETSEEVNRKICRTIYSGGSKKKEKSRKSVESEVESEGWEVQEK